MLPPDEVLFGNSPAMEDVRQKALKICRTNVPVRAVDTRELAFCLRGIR